VGALRILSMYKREYFVRNPALVRISYKLGRCIFLPPKESHNGQPTNGRISLSERKIMKIALFGKNEKLQGSFFS